MSESKQKKIAERLTKELTDKGLIIEAGWVALKHLCIPEGAPEIQITEMRNAFFAGAHHLFSSILVILDPGEEPTDTDMERLDLIHKELDKFITDYKLRHFVKPHGSA